MFFRCFSVPVKTSIVCGDAEGTFEDATASSTRTSSEARIFMVLSAGAVSYKAVSLFDLLRASTTHDQDDQSGESNNDTDQLRRRQTGQSRQSEHVAARIVAYEFDSKADD